MMTQYVGLLGKDIGYSISPAFQQAAFDHLGLDTRYEIWDTPEDGLADRLEIMRVPRILGANVTQPYKETVIPHLDELDYLARRIGAVNTIANQSGRLSGHNTDATGFLRALQDEASFDPRGGRVLLLGAGGAARAVAFALTEAGVSVLSIVNRTQNRAERLKQDLERELAKAKVSLEVWPWEERERAATSSGLVVNCTKLGTLGGELEAESPLSAPAIPKEALVYDLVYNPEVTQLLAEAKKAGARILGGLPMLVYQGAAAFELWTGQEAPLGVMMKSARRALE